MIEAQADLWRVVLGVVLLGLAYGTVFATLSRLGRRPPRPGPGRPFFVYVVPCLNEEPVIGRSLDRLLAMPARDYAILVIDDGCEDGTAEIVRGYDPRRVWLLRRTSPHARQGKGAALNHAFRYLRESGLLGDRDPHDVVVAVCDADGCPHTFVRLAALRSRG